MSEMDRREATLKQDGYLIGIASLSLLVGANFSPYFEPAAILIRPVLFSYSITSQILVFYITSLMLSVFSVLIAGVPVALFERFSGRQQSDQVSMLLWLFGMFLLAVPVIGNMLSGG